MPASAPHQRSTGYTKEQPPEKAFQEKIMRDILRQRNAGATQTLKGIIGTVASVALLTFTCSLIIPAADDMKAFPPAEEGMTRHVIRLPQAKDESASKVELIIGKTVKTDPINHYFFSGKLETENIPGWGFDRYVLRKLGTMAGTLMAVDPAAPQVERFVSLSGETILRYNSRLPIVVYVPAGVEVRYRLWRAEPTFLSRPEERR
jgi:ecotin